MVLCSGCMRSLIGCVLYREHGLAGADAQAPLPAQGSPAGRCYASICSQGPCQPGPYSQSGHTCCGGARPVSLLAVR